MARTSGDTIDMACRADTSLSYNLSLLEAYFRAKKVEDSKLHKILFVAGPILGFILAFFCFYAVFLGVTEQSNKIFDKKDQEISYLQKTTEHYRSVIEGTREALIHEKYEDVRIVNSDLQKCEQSHKESLENVLGLQNALQQSAVQTNEMEKEFLQRMQKKEEQIRKLANELKETKIKADRISAVRDLGNLLLAVAALCGIVYFGVFQTKQYF